MYYDSYSGYIEAIYICVDVCVVASERDGRRRRATRDAPRRRGGDRPIESSVGFVRALYRRCRRRRGLVRVAVRLVSVRCTHRNEPPHRVRYAH